MTAFRVERDGDLAIIWFDLPGEKVNKFSSTVMAEFAALVDQMAASTDIRSIVIASAKPGIFIAGADITEFTKVTNADQAREYTRFGQQALHRFSKLPQVTVAAINGACLGGGCELALSCDYRVMADAPKTVIGLPEVRLGIFPAWGGTTKLPRLIGLPAALDIILKGRTLDARRARRVGLVDEVVPPAILLQTAKDIARARSKRRKGATKFYIEGNPLARKLIFSRARKAVMAETRGDYPAPLAALDVMEHGLAAGVESGLEREVDRIAPLILGDVAQNLVRLFFLNEEAKKNRTTAQPHDVEHAGILGAGVMGGGIAQIVADKTDATVRLRDIAWPALAGGMNAAARIFRRMVERRRMTRGEMERKLARITSTTDWSGFARVDLAIEAVVEKLEIKRRVLTEFEAVASESAIFASNTSTIPITDIAAASSHPERVAGMHFFNPVDRMPLVEVIRGAKTSDATLATVAAFARKLGKTVVMCNDGPGFVVNRILAPYLSEAGFLLEEGNTIESIDDAMTAFGMPMGPLALLDEIGIDVATKAGTVLSQAFAPRLATSKALDALLADGRLGRKNGKGLYVYRDGERGKPDPTVYRLLGASGRTRADALRAVERMVFPMVNEAAAILEEKIVATAGEVDLAMITGTGFPPFRGGLLRYADSVGLPYILARLSEMEARFGPRFKATPALKRLAESGGKFTARS